MTFHIITIFPEVFEPYLKTSIIGRAREKNLVDFDVVNLRDYTTDKHKSVDDTPFGGGAGMILAIKPIYEAIKSIAEVFVCSSLLKTEEAQSSKLKAQRNAKIKKSKSRIILLSAKGKKFTQKKARELSKLDDVVLICGRYEGVDERVAEHIADEEISIGDYVLTGGELPAMVVADAVTRLIPGAIAKDSLREESFGVGAGPVCPSSLKIENCLEYPQYTRPAVFKTDEGEEWKVPEILLSGNHEEIRKWRMKENL